MDDDGNKQLSQEEFSEGIKDMGLALDDAHVESLFKQFDSDGSGTLSVEEFLAAIRVLITA